MDKKLKFFTLDGATSDRVPRGMISGPELGDDGTEIRGRVSGALFLVLTALKY